jgi:hypothetical protein
MRNSLLYVFIRKTKYFICFLLVIGINSCEKESESSDPCRDNTKIRQVNADTLTLEQITYTGDCMVSEFIQEFSYKKYTYNLQGRLIKTEQAITLNPLSCFMPTPSPDETYTDPRKAKITQYHAYEYDDEGKLIKKLNYFLNGEQFRLVFYQTFDYENDLIKQLNRYTPQGELTEKNTYTYDENGNIIRDESFFRETGTSFVLMYTNEYMFDDKVNPYLIFENEGIPGVYTNRNNIIKNTYINNYSGEGYSYTTDYSYEYNASGLPVKLNNLTFIYGK